METKHKTWEECCDEVAKKTPYGNTWTSHISNLGMKFFQEAAELYNQETARERDELKEELKDCSEVLRQMVDINMANQAFDKSDDDWRKRHKVTEGESFPHWYMRHHSEEMRLLKEENERLKGAFVHDSDLIEMASQIDSLKQINSELVEAIIKCEKVFDVYQEYMQGVLEPESELTLQLIKSMIKRAKKTQP